MKRWIVIGVLVFALGYVAITLTFEIRKNTVLNDLYNETNETISTLENKLAIGQKTEDFIRKLHDGEHLTILTERATEAAIAEGNEIDSSNEGFDELRNEMVFHLCSYVNETHEMYLTSCIYTINSFHNQTLLVADTTIQMDVTWTVENNEWKVDKFEYKTLSIVPYHNEEGAN